jgi:sugar phosphate isomerase/epimerase
MRSDRRAFLQTMGAVAGMGVVGLNNHLLGETPLAKGAPNAEKLGWRLATQAWSFNDFTFYEAIAKTASLGLRFIEAFPGQTLKKGLDLHFGEGLSAAGRKEVLKRLADNGLKVVNYGVGGSGKGTFEFAKEMGIETIVAEPAFNEFDALDKLCEEFQINVALHNHPKPSRYWDPATVLKVTRGHCKRIGACADTGHWMRSNINPLEALKMLEGRIISFHFKDLNEMGDKGHDVPFGTGKGNVKGMLAEILRQKLKAVFSIEYEYNFGHSLPEIAQCVTNFDKFATELAGG